MGKFHDNFDYENARRDIRDAGGDPDYLSYSNPAKRDEFMKKMKMDPQKYGSKWGDFSNLDKTGGSGSGSGTSGCFLTSACVKAAGLPDDCEELTTLRWFRDNYMRNAPGGEEDIQNYYRIAPEIVSAINRRDDARSIWDNIYHELIIKCVRLIRTGDLEGTYQAYKKYTLQLYKQISAADMISIQA